MTLAVPLQVPRALTRPRATADRLAVLDACRAFAALGVVWFHTLESEALRPSGILGRFSVAFYTLLGMLFLFEHLQKNPDRTWAQYARSRFGRLYVPFLAWTALSFPILLLARQFDPGVPIPTLGIDLLVTGATLPLWFIPFCFVASLLVFPLARAVLGRPGREALAAAGCIGVALWLDFVPWDVPPLQGVPLVGKFLALSWNRWSAVYWGIALAILYARWLKTSPWRSAIAVGGLAALLGLAAYQWHFGAQPHLKVYGGIGLALFTLAPWRHALLTHLAAYAPLSTGIYFAHMTFILLIRAILNRTHPEVCWQRDVLVYTLTLGLCILLLRGLQRIKRLAPLVG